MDTRQSRERRHRLVLGAGLVVSLAVHAAALGTFGFDGPPGPATRLPIRPAEMAVFRTPSIELVEIEAVPEQVVLEPVIADAPPVPTAPTSEDLWEPKHGVAPVAMAGEAAASAAGAAGGPKVAEDRLPVVVATAETGIPATLPPSMSTRFGGPSMAQSIREPLEAPDPRGDHDRVEGEGEEKRSWWRRLGAKFGIGDGSNICVPRPEVIGVDPELAEK